MQKSFNNPFSYAEERSYYESCLSSHVSECINPWLHTLAEYSLSYYTHDWPGLASRGRLKFFYRMELSKRQSHHSDDLDDVNVENNIIASCVACRHEFAFLKTFWNYRW